MRPSPVTAPGAGRVVSFLAGIRGRMLVLLMAAGIPVIVIATGNALQGQESALQEGHRRLVAERDVAAAQGGFTLETVDNLLHGLAQAEEVRVGVGCQNILRRVLELHPGRYGNLWVRGSAGDVACSALPQDAPPVLPAPERFRRPDSMVLGDFIPDPGGGPAAMPFALVVPATSPSLVVGGTLLLTAFAPPGMRRTRHQRAWLVDGSGNTWSLAAHPAGGAPSPATRRELANTDRVLVAGATDGETMAYAGAPLAEDLSLVVGHPYGPLREAAWSTLLQRLAELAAFLVVCLAAIVIGADLAMVRPLHSLAQRVKSWRPGTPFERPPFTTEPREVIELEEAFDDTVRTLARREADLEAALEQRDALMAEIHHRVKNNLQIVSSLLNLQANRISDPEAQSEFRAARNRVRALTTLHRHLYLQQSFEAISLRPFLEELAAQQFAAQGEVPGDRIALSVDAVDLSISTDQAVSVALLVTEAITNAVTHAFPDDQGGTVTVTVAREAGDVVVTVGDDGVGLSKGAEGGGLGLQLLDGFARQLGGRLARRPGPGTGWTVRFPLRERAAAPRRPEAPREAA